MFPLLPPFLNVYLGITFFDYKIQNLNIEETERCILALQFIGVYSVLMFIFWNIYSLYGTSKYTFIFQYLILGILGDLFLI